MLKFPVLSSLYLMFSTSNERKYAGMSNKELATHIYLSILKAIAVRSSDPNYSGEPFTFPSLKKMIDDIDELASVISTIRGE